MVSRVFRVFRATVGSLGSRVFRVRGDRRLRLKACG